MKLTRITRSVLWCLIGGLAACATPPADTAPEAVIPAHYPGLAPNAAERTDTDWRSLFTDPHLLALIDSALTHNRDLKLAVARVAEVRALYDIQQAGSRPGIDVIASGSRARTPADLSVTGAATVSGQYRAGANLSAYEIDFWGRVRSLNEAALAQFLASDEARRAFELGLIAQVANIHLLARELDERIVLARKALVTREESFRIMGRRAEVGSSSNLELRQVESLLINTRGELAALERQRAQNDALLAQLVGHAPPPGPAPVPLAAQGLEAPLAPGLPSGLLTRRPDIRAAEQRLAASRASVRAARAAFLPNITLTAFGGSASAELEGLFRGGSSSWNFTPVLRMPLFDGGRTRAGLELAEARQRVAVADYEATIQTAFREVADALAARQWLAVQVREQQALVAAEADRARLASLRFERGVSNYLDVLDAQRALFAAEQALVQLRRAHMSSTVNLFKALGGNTPA